MAVMAPIEEEDEELNKQEQSVPLKSSQAHAPKKLLHKIADSEEVELETVDDGDEVEKSDEEDFKTEKYEITDLFREAS